ncbi:endonuclease/exonuclease/phosphatase family protein [Nocardioides sp. InS609-2]|uniref:endonuclease/exonuclease/phosphatase family protein n=1 Tax=Nocardioides sp. InS609-2 TaxID=2760705 RepID=UPI0020C008DD|nr:endonuclease/exonuclease/phosphatase family protein [Nocardioides sp. InS609-2]
MRARSVLFWLVVAGFLALAGMLTVLRLVQADGGWWIRGVAFTPLAVPLYAAALVLIVARRVVGGLRGTVLVVLPIAGLVLHSFWLAPLFTGANPPPAAGAEPVIVMTANLSVGRGDGSVVLREASRRGVDLLAVEEITPGALALMEESGLADLFPYREGETGTGIEGTMLFSRTAIDDVVPLATSFGGFTATVVVGEEPLRIVVAHPPSPIGSTSGWRSDHRIVLEAARGVEADLVVGDLNASPDHKVMMDLADAGWRDSVELANDGWLPTWPADGVEPVSDLPSPRLVQIDHVLLGDRWAAVDNDVVVFGGSDHAALVAVVAPK